MHDHNAENEAQAELVLDQGLDNETQRLTSVQKTFKWHLSGYCKGSDNPES